MTFSILNRIDIPATSCVQLLIQFIAGSFSILNRIDIPATTRRMAVPDRTKTFSILNRIDIPATYMTKRLVEDHATFSILNRIDIPATTRVGDRGAWTSALSVSSTGSISLQHTAMTTTPAVYDALSVSSTGSISLQPHAQPVSHG